MRARRKAVDVDPPSADDPSRWRWLRFALAIVLIGTVYFYKLGEPLLWDDEADTGFLARNVLTHGLPVAYDGRNVSVYDNGAQLSASLVSKKIPWVQYYVGALSLKIFG